MEYRRYLACLFLASILGFGRSATAITYSLTDLGNLGGTSSVANALNDAGQVAGSYMSLGYDHGFIWQNGKMKALGDPYSSGGAYVSGISPTGIVIGMALANSDVYPSFNGPVIWQNGLVATFDSTLGTVSAVGGINSAGQIVGTHPGGVFILDLKDGTMHDLGFLGSLAAINEAGQVVGTSAGQAFMFSDNVMTGLGSLGGNSYAYAINSSGEAAGQSYLSDGLTSHAVLFKDGNVIDVNPVGKQSYITALNDSGDAVGTCYDGSNSTNSSSRAFLWENGVATDLNDLIPSDSGVTLVGAQGINNLGEILAYSSTSFRPSLLPAHASPGANKFGVHWNCCRMVIGSAKVLIRGLTYRHELGDPQIAR